MERLWGAQPGTPDGDRFEVIFTLVEAYEDQHYPILPSDPIEAIKFRMEQMGYRQKDLEKIIGHKGHVSEILNRKRKLTLAMVRSLHEKLNIPLSALVQAY
ncbi:MAG: helix-turn-helix domain-containing protein [Bacteroidia bacterium]